MTNDVESAPRRRRDAAATREAVLIAAREVFAEFGYDGAGTREIAAAAGVDARLIGRYFGSKEGLFTEVVERAFEKTLLLGPGHNHEAARALLSDHGDGPADGLLIALRSASNERAAAIMRAHLEANYHRAVTDGLAGPHAAGRALLLIAVCSGVQLMRDVLGHSGLSDDDAGELVPYLEAALDAIVA
ncbi:TetR/AcrR family transcriptional regulator [Solirubrobacter ginsenosidimutans]|uniref:TetR/AcrR family transcriptional regulator n=1 Tax=Solirubrobacter ginsenosidimutans TaxID=490573 RepID=A0A9X3MYT6_9ACTN|nr:TetR/AcrR family transcriptional regulator [Solirubrobacter ginsenosidimutans]MDA0165339.1 TetR/AcrR family transcriptional regulator [Solirubrobacter ginsenosidimutans]